MVYKRYNKEIKEAIDMSKNIPHDEIRAQTSRTVRFWRTKPAPVEECETLKPNSDEKDEAVVVSSYATMSQWKLPYKKRRLDYKLGIKI